MSQPPNGTMRAPSARCCASSGLCRSGRVVAHAVTRSRPRSRARPCADGGRGRTAPAASALGSIAGLDELRRRLEPVLHEQVQVVALVEHADRDLGMLLDEAARLAVLLRHELLVQRGDLDVEVVRGQVEVGGERLHRPAVAIASRA